MDNEQIVFVSKPREVERILPSRSMIEGAGVKINRAFAEERLLDPFLLLDEFHSHTPRDYSAGFPMHPHRGFETVTYMIEGSMTHQDNVGNRGIIRAGEVQWMTAGRGVIHQEMPRGEDEGRLWGIQLWVNLPKVAKMVAPQYRSIAQDQIPEVQVSPDVRARVIAGSLLGRAGPVRELSTDCIFLDIAVNPYSVFEYMVPRTHRAFTYVLDGTGLFGTGKSGPVERGNTIVYQMDGEKIHIQATGSPLRCLLISGQPIGEPIAWRGPIVMNTEQELEAAYNELDQNEFADRAQSSQNNVSTYDVNQT
jgi:redox-sensitive bicupin YhaK (pirin superfamily)